MWNILTGIYWQSGWFIFIHCNIPIKGCQHGGSQPDFSEMFSRNTSLRLKTPKIHRETCYYLYLMCSEGRDYWALFWWDPYNHMHHGWNCLGQFASSHHLAIPLLPTRQFSSTFQPLGLEYYPCSLIVTARIFANTLLVQQYTQPKFSIGGANENLAWYTYLWI